MEMISNKSYLNLFIFYMTFPISNVYLRLAILLNTFFKYWS